ncbi:uncharacterized protein [Amphiura filiformis]|uniref:uncharacterized protein n=1 Tax=Amphiura filiformis TaxID=82378 RepID=UPI003B21E6A4
MFIFLIADASAPSLPYQNVTPSPFTSSITQGSSLSASTDPDFQNPLLNIKIPFGRKPSQTPTPTALRLRKWRNKMMQDEEKYMQVKETDRIRSKIYAKNLTEEQKAKRRADSRERVKRCRLRKKLLTIGVTGNEVEGTRKQAGFQYSGFTTSEVTPGISNVQQSMVGSYQGWMMGNDQQCIVGHEMAKPQQLSSTGVGTSVSPDVPTDVYMWAGPDMVNKETNTDTQAIPRTSEKGCQIQVNSCSRYSDASSQTDLTLNDLSMYDTDDMVIDGGIARRKFIVNDVMRDDQTCSFYTGFSLVMVAWLYHLLKGSIQNHTERDTQKRKKVLVWLRQGLHTEFIAHLFGVTCDTVHRVSESWLGIIWKQLHILDIAKDTEFRTSISDTKGKRLATDVESSSLTDKSAKIFSGDGKQNHTRCAISDMPKLTHTLIFQRNRDFNFTLSSTACIFSHIATSFNTFGLTKFGSYNSSKPLIPSSSVGQQRWYGCHKWISKNSKMCGNLKRTAEDMIDMGSSKRRKLCKRTWKFSREQHVLRSKILKEVGKFKVLQTIYSYSEKVLIQKALMVCVSLANFIVNDTYANLRPN